MFEDLSSRLEGVFRSLRGRGVLTEDNVREALREIRRALLEADVHYKVAKSFVKGVEERAVGQEVLKGIHPGAQVVKIVHEELVTLLGGTAAQPNITGSPPVPVMLVGLQGSGKTTTCAKLANWLKKQGRRPYLVPADPYRPAARDQLVKLARANGHLVYEGPEEDAVEICRRGMQEAVRNAADVALLDTAGRLHVDAELMDELKRVRGVVKPREILLVVDGMIGQDAVNVAEQFQEQLGFDGVVLTKMDGDARGGAALSIRQVTGVPIKFLGVGEAADALELFHPDRMASRILNKGDVLTLVERAQETVQEEEAEDLARKLRKNEFTLDDFRSQLRRLKKMGPLSQVLGMLPGVPKEALSEVEKDGGKSLKRVEAIINSMTPAERDKPSILNGSRRRRIARGSGTSVQEVNQLLKQFTEMRKMMKQMGKMKKGKGRGRFARLPGM
ncbi:signal recognition particle protein [bacterium]|nr:signal recognition particle protein [bacterium]